MALTPKGKIITGYKATDENMRCREFQFELKKWYEHDGDLSMCESGFHFCEYPSGPWAYYDAGRLFKVEAEEVMLSTDPGADLKHVARRIRLVEEIKIDGDGNTGDWNTGNRNTGDWNTGDGNAGNGHSGCLNFGDAKFFIFNKPAKRADVDFLLVRRLSPLLQDDEAIDPSPFLSLPNATPQAIKKLHEAHIKARADQKL